MFSFLKFELFPKFVRTDMREITVLEWWLYQSFFWVKLPHFTSGDEELGDRSERARWKHVQAEPYRYCFITTANFSLAKASKDKFIIISSRYLRTKDHDWLWEGSLERFSGCLSDHQFCCLHKSHPRGRHEDGGHGEPQGRVNPYTIMKLLQGLYHQ